MKKPLNLIFVFIFLANIVFAQQEYNKIVISDTVKINFNNKYFFTSNNLIPFSETIFLKNKRLLPSEYSVSFADMSFSLADSLAYSIFDTLVVVYQSYRYGIKKEYKNRSLITKINVGFRDSIRVIKLEESAFSNDAIFGKDLKKSGTIVRGFTIGTNKDFTLNSGLRLQLSGKLSDDIEITAALTDENTPIQPEGNSEKLEELDKVFIELKHKNAIATFGDYDFIERNGQFGNIDRKLQGLKGNVMFDNYKGSFAYATSRGKFNTNKFNGIDGVQGPYRLTGNNNERNIIVIAGSEKVFLDGEQLKRGENNDYTIEYSNAQITFTPKRLITSASRLTIEYEYSDRQYSRTFLGGASNFSLFANKLNLKVNYFSEGDDKDNPIDLVFTENDKEILKLAGDSQSNATRSGVSLAQPDSLGRVIGSYESVDTLINNDNYTYYIYNPGGINSIYNVTFSYVGENKGDYNSVSLGNYYFVGIGKGAYLPIKFLPMPQQKQLGNVFINYRFDEEINLEIELAGSSYDKNTFSAIDDNDNYGYSRSIIFEVKPKKIELFDIDLGKLGVNYKDRFVESRFSSLDRIDPIEFDRTYNIDQSINNDEILREFTLTILPHKTTSIASKYGLLKKGDSFSSNRFNSAIKSSIDKLYDTEYTYDYVKSENGNLVSNWIKQFGKLGYYYNFLKLGVDFLAELKKDFYFQSDSLQGGSLQYTEFSPSFDVISFNGFDFSFKYSMRKDFLPLSGKLENYSDSKIQAYSLGYKGIPEVTSNIILTFRKLNYSEVYKNKGFSNNETILFKSQTRFNFWKNFIDGDLFYETTTEKVAKLEKVFIRVQKGSGNYIYLGDLNNNGLPDENEFEQTIYDGDYIVTTLPTDELFPVINLKANTRWRVDFNKIPISKSDFLSIIKPISTETLIRIEENSKEKDLKQIYLLNFDKFLNDSTTVRGTNLIQQDIFLFRNSSDLSFRYRYTQRKTLNSYSGGIEKGYYRENTFRIRMALVKEIINQTDYTVSVDNFSAPTSQNRSRLLNSSLISSDFSYRPYQMVEVGFIISVGRDEDSFPEKPTIIDINTQSIRFTLSFAGKGRLRMEFERKELVANNSENIIPFEVTRGNNLGKNFIGSLNFDYRIGSNLQTTLNYSGRKLGESNIIHTLKAEARAFF